VELEEKKMSAKIGPLIFQLFSGCVDHPQQLRKPRVDAFDKPHIVERNNDPSRSMSVDLPVGNQPMDYVANYRVRHKLHIVNLLQPRIFRSIAQAFISGLPPIYQRFPVCSP
jgi:hypothetical protein